ncbi:MAG: FtsW/RodA/SpoVE family cell cycle protein [Oscillospiraceae bacterium]|nr:FtsW/RodA/SpoVE family cell cycle protein [Oscillospiraceae bacterium]
MDVLTETLLLGAKWALPLLALWILARCLRSMLRERYEPEVWGWLEAMDGSRAALKHWECILGRAESCDVTIRSDAVLDTHAVLVRSDRGRWTLYDLSGGDTLAEGETDAGRGLELQDGDVLWFGDQRMIFHDLDEAQRAAVERERGVPGALVSQGLTLLLLSIFQLLLALEYTQVTEGRAQMETALGFAFLILLEWCCYLLMRAMDRRGFELETLAFFLCTLGLAVSASSVPEEMPKQILMLLAGVLLYLFLGFWFRDLRRTKALRWPVAAAALGFLALNVALGVRANGASNWLDVGMFRLQPSEFVKLAYIYVGATSLDRLYRRRNLFLFIGFSAVVVGALALMGDFGAALIFFVTFLVISFLRSGSFATVFLAVAGAVLAGVLVLTVKPYVAQRFAAWGHVWEDPYGAGWQQTQALSAAASGGLTGVGAGRGWLHKVFAADTDMVFCLVSEELGLLVALCAILAVIGVAVFAVRSAARGRSSFFVIAACSAAAMLVTQLALNVFGSTDILPFTGVTFPFVSKGGSSLISCWGMLAFFKAADTRQNASFSVRLSARRRFQEYEDEQPEGGDDL